MNRFSVACVTGTLPVEWQTRLVVAVFKKGDQSVSCSHEGSCQSPPRLPFVSAYVCYVHGQNLKVSPKRCSVWFRVSEFCWWLGSVGCITPRTPSLTGAVPTALVHSVSCVFIYLQQPLIKFLFWNRATSNLVKFIDQFRDVCSLMCKHLNLRLLGLINSEE